MIEKVSRDIILCICYHLHPIEIYRLKQTCKRIYNMNMDIIYKYLLKKNYNYDISNVQMSEVFLENIVRGKYVVFNSGVHETKLLEILISDKIEKFEEIKISSGLIVNIKNNETFIFPKNRMLNYNIFSIFDFLSNLYYVPPIIEYHCQEYFPMDKLVKLCLSNLG